MTLPTRHRSPRPVPLLRLLGCGGLALVAGQALAQSAAGSPRLQIVPSLSLTQSITDARRGSDGVDRAEAVTTVAPGVRITSRSGRVQGTVDYSLAGLVYARDNDANEIQHRLSAAVTAEAVQDHLTVDLRGSISRQAVSAFGLQSADPTTASSNYSQVKTFSVAPVFRATLAGVLDFRTSLVLSTTDTGTNSISDSTNGTAAVHLGSVPGSARVGWGLDATRQIVDFDRGRRTEEDRLVASVGVLVDPEFRVDLRAGIEDSNVATLTKERTNTWGGGFVWTPSQRTRLAASADRRSFGHSHAFEFQHRMRRTVLRLSDRQDVTSGANASGAVIPAFDLFFALFASQEPDPVLREQLVNDLLQRNNLSPAELVNGGFLTGSSTLQRRQELSLALEGMRTTYLVSVFNTDSRRAFELITGGDDLDLGSLAQRGLSFSVSHRLTPTAALGLNATFQRSRADTGVRSGRLNTITANWSDRLSQRSNLTIGVRHSTSDGSTQSTSENSVLANLRMTF